MVTAISTTPKKNRKCVHRPKHVHKDGKVEDEECAASPPLWCCRFLAVEFVEDYVVVGFGEFAKNMRTIHLESAINGFSSSLFVSALGGFDFAIFTCANQNLAWPLTYNNPLGADSKVGHARGASGACVKSSDHQQTKPLDSWVQLYQMSRPY